MSKFVDHIFTIHNNPFVLSPLICEFFKNSRPKPNNILLAYLVLPLVLNECSKMSLKNANVRSSILSFGSRRENFFGLPERVNAYKEVTNKCIMHAKNNGILKINDDLSVEIIGNIYNVMPNLEDSAKAARNIHKIFKDLDVTAIYRLLGVKEL